ncbi:DgyrCDS10345 [Dimorphilus gyrociliatus]|uniref:DgyrCDS10345 n=1 Tax=Dimorphilus gyrociliatus TaxID=2664684 RepID=A0A7I8W525_9ANNE|nr:DgyrCDS10345 [Dimorphilus gyrociliatus]
MSCTDDETPSASSVEEPMDDDSQTKKTVDISPRSDIEFLKYLRKSRVSLENVSEVYAFVEHSSSSLKHIEKNGTNVESDDQIPRVDVTSVINTGVMPSIPLQLQQPVDYEADNSACKCSQIQLQNDGEKQQCQMTDSIYMKSRMCCELAFSNNVFRIHVRLPYVVMCEKHTEIAKKHHCCTICGQHCLLGKFYVCEKKHLTHVRCANSVKVKKCEHCDSENWKEELFTLKYCSEAIRREIVEKHGAAQMKIKKKTYSLSDEARNKLQRSFATISVSNDSFSSSRTYNNLHAAVKHGDTSGILQCIRNGADLDKISEGLTPLLRAVKNCDIVAVDILLWAGASLSIRDDECRTPFLIASKIGNLDIVKQLLNYGACICDLDLDGRTALHMAALSNDLEVVKLITDLIDVDIEDNCGYTALMDCSENRCENVAEFLLSLGANPNHADIEGSTSLHWAAYGGSFKLVHLFVSTCCNPRIPNNAGDLPLHIALRQEHHDIAEYLAGIEGTNVKHKNQQGETAFDLLPKDKIHLLSMFDNRTNFEAIVSEDVSNGREKMAIPAFNGIDAETKVDAFQYIIRNYGSSRVVYNEIVSQNRFCSCSFDCSENCSCSELHGCYDENGRLKSKVSGPIFECSVLCPCWNNRCKNRVLSKGIQYNLEVFRTSDRRWSLRSGQFIPKGSFICELNGIYEKESRNEISVSISKQTSLFLTTDVASNIGRFVRRDSEANLIYAKVFINQYDTTFPRIGLFAKRNIQTGEELICDFRQN